MPALRTLRNWFWRGVDMSEHEVIYITGPPASGKTTLIKRLGVAFPLVRIFVYSELLSEYITKRDRLRFSQKKLREVSAGKITPGDIWAVDQDLISEVRRARRSQHVLIDSHPVTKEHFGFRVTPFSVALLRDLAPSRICMLYADAGTVIKRIRKHPKGRPLISTFEADFHCLTQASLAIIYGVELGVPIFFYDSSKGVGKAFTQLGRYICP